MKRGRKPKFQPGDVAAYPDGTTQHVAIVDWRSDSKGRGEYRIIRVTHPRNGHLYGDTTWVKSYLLHPMPFTFKRAVAVYRANEKLGTAGERGCRCNCCPHTAIPLSDIRADGTYKWETDNE